MSTETSSKATVPALRIGLEIVDNDPRMGSRTLEISKVEGNYLFAKRRTRAGLDSREIRILKRRVYTDGKPRKSGFSLKQET